MWTIPELTEAEHNSLVKIPPYPQEKCLCYKLKLFMLQLGKGDLEI